MQEGRVREYSDNVRPSVVYGSLASSATDQHCSSNTSRAAATLPTQAVYSGRLACIASYRMRSKSIAWHWTEYLLCCKLYYLDHSTRVSTPGFSYDSPHAVVSLVVCYSKSHFLQVVQPSWVHNSGRAVVNL